MLHSNGPNSGFYHIPKTGGRAYLKIYLGIEVRGHQIINPPPDKKITIIARCPVDRFISSYYFLNSYENRSNVDVRAFDKLSFLNIGPLQVAKKLQTLDINSRFVPMHFHTVQHWSQNIKPSQILWVDYIKFKEAHPPINRFITTSRPELLNTPDFDDIVKFVYELYAEDYAFFAKFPELCSIKKNWVGRM